MVATSKTIELAWNQRLFYFLMLLNKLCLVRVLSKEENKKKREESFLRHSSDLCDPTMTFPILQPLNKQSKQACTSSWELCRSQAHIPHRE